MVLSHSRWVSSLNFFYKKHHIILIYSVYFTHVMMLGLNCSFRWLMTWHEMSVIDSLKSKSLRKSNKANGRSTKIESGIVTVFDERKQIEIQLLHKMSRKFEVKVRSYF